MGASGMDGLAVPLTPSLPPLFLQQVNKIALKRSAPSKTWVSSFGDCPMFLARPTVGYTSLKRCVRDSNEWL